MDNSGRVLNDNPPHNIHQYLGHHVWLRYSVHQDDGVIMAIGSTFIILDNGAMIYSPAIDSITTTRPARETRKIKISVLPTNLGDLF